MFSFYISPHVIEQFYHTGVLGSTLQYRKTATAARLRFIIVLWRLKMAIIMGLMVA
jgi:hypothetical protein